MADQSQQRIDTQVSSHLMESGVLADCFGVKPQSCSAPDSQSPTHANIDVMAAQANIFQVMGQETFMTLRSILIAQQLEYRCQLHIYQWLLLQHSILDADASSTGSRNEVELGAKAGNSGQSMSGQNVMQQNNGSGSENNGSPKLSTGNHLGVRGSRNCSAHVSGSRDALGAGCRSGSGGDGSAGEGSAGGAEAIAIAMGGNSSGDGGGQGSGSDGCREGGSTAGLYVKEGLAVPGDPSARSGHGGSSAVGEQGGAEVGGSSNAWRGTVGDAVGDAEGTLCQPGQPTKGGPTAAALSSEPRSGSAGPSGQESQPGGAAKVNQSSRMPGPLLPFLCGTSTGDFKLPWVRAPLPDHPWTQRSAAVASAPPQASPAITPATSACVSAPAQFATQLPMSVSAPALAAALPTSAPVPSPSPSFGCPSSAVPSPVVPATAMPPPLGTAAVPQRCSQPVSLAALHAPVHPADLTEQIAQHDALASRLGQPTALHQGALRNEHDMEQCGSLPPGPAACVLPPVAGAGPLPTAAPAHAAAVAAAWPNLTAFPVGLPVPSTAPLAPMQGVVKRHSSAPPSLGEQGLVSSPGVSGLQAHNRVLQGEGNGKRQRIGGADSAFRPVQQRQSNRGVAVNTGGVRSGGRAPASEVKPGASVMGSSSAAVRAQEQQGVAQAPQSADVGAVGGDEVMEDRDGGGESSGGEEGPVCAVEGTGVWRGMHHSAALVGGAVPMAELQGWGGVQGLGGQEENRVGAGGMERVELPGAGNAGMFAGGAAGMVLGQGAAVDMAGPVLMPVRLIREGGAGAPDMAMLACAMQSTVDREGGHRAPPLTQVPVGGGGWLGARGGGLPGTASAGRAPVLAGAGAISGAGSSDWSHKPKAGLVSVIHSLPHPPQLSAVPAMGAQHGGPLPQAAPHGAEVDTSAQHGAGVAGATAVRPAVAASQLEELQPKARDGERPADAAKTDWGLDASVLRWLKAQLPRPWHSEQTAPADGEDTGWTMEQVVALLADPEMLRRGHSFQEASQSNIAHVNALYLMHTTQAAEQEDVLYNVATAEAPPAGNADAARGAVAEEGATHKAAAGSAAAAAAAAAVAVHGSREGRLGGAGRPHQELFVQHMSLAVPPPVLAASALRAAASAEAAGNAAFDRGVGSSYARDMLAAHRLRGWDVGIADTGSEVSDGRPGQGEAEAGETAVSASPRVGMEGAAGGEEGGGSGGGVEERAGLRDDQAKSGGSGQFQAQG